jgi:hypothetical protein
MTRSATIGSASDRLEDIGLFSTESPRALIAISIFVIVSRILFYEDGFGAHPDEWLVIRSGIQFWLDDHYMWSRAPGYPLIELIMGGAALVGGPIACAVLSTLASVAVIALLWRFLATRASAAVFWPCLAFAAHPWFWASGITSLDGVWQLAALLAALCALDSRNYFLAGLASGLGFGFRPSSVFWCGIIFVKAVQQGRSLRAASMFAASAALPLVITFALFLSQAHYFADLNGAVSVNLIFGRRNALLSLYRGGEFVGEFPAVLLLLGFAVFRFRRLWSRLTATAVEDWHLAAIFVAYLALFALHPEKTEYLFPIFPFLFVVLSRFLSIKAWQALTAAFVLSAFIVIDAGTWSPRGTPKFDIHFERGAVLRYDHNISETTAVAARFARPPDTSNAVIRVDADYWALENAYVIAMVRYPSMRDETGEDYVVPIRLRSSSDGTSVFSHFYEWVPHPDTAALYYPARNTLVITRSAPGGDVELLKNVQAWWRDSG